MLKNSSLLITLLLLAIFSNLHAQNNTNPPDYLPDPNLGNYITERPDWSGIWIKDWTNDTNYTSVIESYRHITAGESIPLRWEKLEEQPGVFDFSLLKENLETALENDDYYNFELWSGNRAPSWLWETEGVANVVLTSGESGYPNYKSEIYKSYAKRFFNAMADELATYDQALIDRLVFLMPGFGATGDRQLFKGTPADPQYILSKEEYVAYMQEMTQSITTAFWKNDETSNQRFRWNIEDYDGAIDDPGADEEEAYGAWMKQHYNVQIRKQQFTIAIGYMSPDEMDQDNEQRDNFFGNNPDRWDGNPEYVIGEFQEERFADTPMHNINPKLNYHWTSISSVDRGLDGWDIKYTYLNTDFIEAYEFSERYSFHKKASTSPVAFIALRDMLDYSDAERFPAVDYGGGAINKSNQTRIEAILEEFEDYGAANDDMNAVLTSNRNRYIENSTGWNDCLWNVIDRNYRRFITQINPNTTSKGYWRVGLDANGAGQPYGRFARGFDVASNNNTMYFDVDDAYFADEIQNNQGGLKVKVIYYEDDGGSWRFRYRAQDGTMKTAGTVVNDATAGNGWSSIEFLIEDAKLDNGGAFGSDFILKNIGGTNVRFHLIELDSRVDTSLSINDVSATDTVAISVTPNPTAGIFTINTDNSSIKNVTIRDIQGRIIRKLNGNENTKMKLDIADLNSAIYFVTIQTENGNQSLKIVKK